MEIIDLLLDSEVDVNKSYNMLPQILIFLAMSLGYVECTRKLLRSGTRLNTTWPSSILLSLVATMGDVELLEYIRDCGIDKSFTYENGRTVLHRAVVIGKIDVIRFFLDLGATKLPPQYSNTNSFYIHFDIKHWDNETTIIFA